MNVPKLAFCLLIFASATLTSVAYESQVFDEGFYSELELNHNQSAVGRAQKWQALIESNKDESELDKIRLVNYFFNNYIKYKSDIYVWGKDDYWASPAETIGRGMGDCEDYVIAKFFSLISLGMPEENLRLMYVRHLTLDVPHMVLLYTENKNSKSLVLDNYNPRILPVDLRRDLKPIYSFNGKGLWMSKSKGLGKKIKNSKGVSAWRNLVTKIENEK